MAREGERPGGRGAGAPGRDDRHGARWRAAPGGRRMRRPRPGWAIALRRAVRRGRVLPREPRLRSVRSGPPPRPRVTRRGGNWTAGQRALGSRLPGGRPGRLPAHAGASRARSSCCFRRACRCRVVGTTAREPPLSGSLVRPLPGAPPDGGRDLVVTGAGRAPGRDALTRSRGARERQDACSRADHAVAPARRRRSGRSTPARRPGTAQSARRTHASASPAGA